MTYCQERAGNKRAASSDVTGLPALHQWELTSHQPSQTWGSLSVTSCLQAWPGDTLGLNRFTVFYLFNLLLLPSCKYFRHYCQFNILRLIVVHLRFFYFGTSSMPLQRLSLYTWSQPQGTRQRSHPWAARGARPTPKWQRTPQKLTTTTNRAPKRTQPTHIHNKAKESHITLSQP